MNNNSCPALNGRSPNCSTRWKPSWLMHGHLSPQHLTSLIFYFQQTWLMMSNETLAHPLPSPRQLIGPSLASSTIRGRWWRYLICLQVGGWCKMFLVRHDKGFQKNPRQMFQTPDKCSFLSFRPRSARTFETEGKFSVAICTEGCTQTPAAANWIQRSNWSLMVAPWAAPASCPWPAKGLSHPQHRECIQGPPQLEGEMKT